MTQNCEIVKDYMKAIQTDGKTKETYKTYGNALKNYCTWADANSKDILTATPISINAYRAHLSSSDSLSDQSVLNYLICVKAFYGWLLALEMIEKNPVVSRLLPKVVEKESVYMTDKEAHTFMHIASQDEHDLAIVLLQYGSGLRISELCNVKAKDINFTQRTIRIFGKGQKYRDVLMSPYAASKIQEYVAKHCRTPEQRVIHCRIEGVRRRLKAINGQWNYIMAQDNANWTPKNITSHKLRHSYCTSLLISGMPLVQVRDLMGHVDAKTTQRYYHGQATDYRQAFDKHAPI